LAAPSFTVTFLGTGSGAPTLERNLACVAVQRLGELFLFDCGEATQIQYRRAALGFAPLSAILISHLHGDHVTGLIGLLMSLQLADRMEPLTIFGPGGLKEYISCNRRALGTGFAYRVDVKEIESPGEVYRSEAYRISCAFLDHRVTCLGFSIAEFPRPGRFQVEAAARLGVPQGPLFGQLQRGQPVALADGREVTPEMVLGPPRPGASIAYCTDTRPCEAAIALAQDADLLIHEGTFEEGMADDAHRKGHSTVTDAARVAKAAAARRLAITHLSPRYRDAGPLRQQARAIFPDTIVARDLLRLEVYPRDEDAPADAQT
jgi:ribonuclease Z